MVTPEQLREEAVEADTIAGKLEKAAAAHRRQAERCRKLADEIEADAVDTNAVLTKPRRLSRVDSTPMEESHKLAISRGRSSGGGDRAFKVAYRSKKYTLTSLAAAVGCDASLLSKYRQKVRPIPQERAEKVSQLIPWPADGKHWPGGIVPKD